MRIGLVGYGTGGRHFHAPFIAAARGVELAGVVARAPATVGAPGSGAGGPWWDVAVPKDSERRDVQAAREAYEEPLKERPVT